MNNEANRDTQRGSVLILVLLFMVLFFGLGMALLASATAEASIANNDEWFEGALYAAEAGLQTGIDQVNQNITTSVAAVPSANIGNLYTFRSGGRADGNAQPLTYIGSSTSPGYSVNVGTGYNPSGYLFLQYRVNATGVGPRNIAREVEAQVEYGPTAN